MVLDPASYFLFRPITTPISDSTLSDCVLAFRYRSTSITYAIHFVVLCLRLLFSVNSLIWRESILSDLASDWEQCKLAHILYVVLVLKNSAFYFCLVFRITLHVTLVTACWPPLTFSSRLAMERSSAVL